MAHFWIAFVVFFIGHSLFPRPFFKQRLTAALGQRGYLVFYSLLSTVLLVWLIWAALDAPYVEIWAPAEWLTYVPVLLMPVAFMLFLAALFQPNPFSVSFVKAGYDAEKPGVLRITRHPILVSFAVWALAHVPANGDLVSIVLFGSLGLFAVLGAMAMERVTRRRMGDDWAAAARATCGFSLAAFFHALIGGGRALDHGLGVWVWFMLGLVGYVLFLLYAHILLFGVDPLWAF